MMRRGLVLVALAAAGCSGDPEPGAKPKELDRAALLDPASCTDCHADHVREWSGSMHAYAADDPVFLAMNARGQRETNGALGAFCVNCHAPMAVIEGATTDGLNLADVPQSLKGVTCYYCHSVDAVEGTHNAPLRLSDDLTMRGGFADPVDNKAHRSSYSPLHDRNQLGSSDVCGACHDIVTPAGVHLERTYLEWQQSLFGSGDPGSLSCSQCHMKGRQGIVADAPGVFQRTRHLHDFPGVDTALTPFPEKEAQLAAVQSELDATIEATLCVAPFQGGAKVSVTLDNIAGGHMWPSGAVQDRRAWVTLTAYSGTDVLYESGNVPEGQSVTDLVDPDLWLLRDRIYDAAGEEVHMFWEAASYDSELLPPAVTNDKNDPAFYHGVTRDYPALPQMPTRITVSVQLQPVGLDVLDKLVASGDLDPAIRAAMPTFRLAGADAEWVTDDGFDCVK